MGVIVRRIVSFPWRARLGGFTLLELMITVAIVGILAKLVYPSYVEYVKRGKRAELTTIMLASAQFMERYYTENRQYPSNDVFQERFRYVPPGASARNANYVLRLDESNQTMFKMSATRNATGAMNGDICGQFILDNFGRKSLNPESIDMPRFDNDVDEAIKYCWR
jgi:type IV pilus assembly protein PilE